MDRRKNLVIASKRMYLNNNKFEPDIFENSENKIEIPKIEIKNHENKEIPEILEEVDLPETNQIKKKASCDITGDNDESCGIDETINKKNIDPGIFQLKENPFNWEDEVIMIKQNDCPNCKEAEKILEDKISSGQIRKIDVDSKEAKEIDKQIPIEDIPVFIEKKNNQMKSCFLYDDNKIYCGNEETELKFKDKN